MEQKAVAQRKSELLMKEKINTPNQSMIANAGDENNFDVAVCLPALYYYTKDISLQMVEWFEMLKAMKVSKVFTYAYDIHPNMMKILRHYEKEGMASITHFHNPTPFVNTPILRK